MRIPMTRDWFAVNFSDDCSTLNQWLLFQHRKIATCWFYWKKMVPQKRIELPTPSLRISNWYYLLILNIIEEWWKTLSSHWFMPRKRLKKADRLWATRPTIALLTPGAIDHYNLETFINYEIFHARMELLGNAIERFTLLNFGVELTAFFAKNIKCFDPYSIDTKNCPLLATRVSFFTMKHSIEWVPLYSVDSSRTNPPRSVYSNVPRNPRARSASFPVFTICQ